MKTDLMILDDFIFNQSSLLPENDAMQFNADFTFTKAIKAETPNFQFLGVGEKTRKLSGSIYPIYMGGTNDLAKLKQKMFAGVPVMLTDSNGKKLGKYLILSISEEPKHKLADGTPQRIDYSIDLRQVD